jgi:Phytanoyl-CoA dioxygenase (PhyH)
VTNSLIEPFVRDGFVKLAGGVPSPVVDACVDLLWEATGLDRRDPSTWTEPVQWVGGMAQPPFVQAMNSLVLLQACDELAGPGRWKPRTSMGSFPLRFPNHQEPPGLGWHVEGSYMPEGSDTWWTNVRSRDRALLALYLFTDVDIEDGPTRIRVGSHLAVPAVLQPFGEEGAPGPGFAPQLVAATDHCEEAYATGRAGDIYVCHPFLVHAAQANHGPRPRFIGQPAIPANFPYRFDHPRAELSPVELTIRQGLDRIAGAGPAWDGQMGATSAARR